MESSSSRFHDIAPLNEQDVPAAIHQLLAEPKFIQILTHLFPNQSIDKVKALFQSVKSVHDFQHKIDYPFLLDVEANTTFGIHLEGADRLTPTENYLYLSNHRDIILDASFLCIKLMDKGFDTVEIAVGDNLLIEPWIETLVRLNKSFIVRRGLRGRQQLETSRLLSEYIRYAIQSKHQSVWLAQREGRAKDSNDFTQESLLKMLAMSGDATPIENLASLSICPLTISYEYDPCDFLKAKELQQRRDNPYFQKSSKDDLWSMQTGVTGFKGNIIYVLGEKLQIPIERLSLLPRSEQFSEIAKSIDHEIHRNYHIYASNRIAYDQLFPDQALGGYTDDEKAQYENYIVGQIAKIDLPNKDEAFLKLKLLEIYANPLVNYLVAMI
jgi:hypothetical protein